LKSGGGANRREVPAGILQVDLVLLRAFHADQQIEEAIVVDVSPGDVLVEAGVVEADRDAGIGKGAVAVVAQDVARGAAVRLADENVDEPVSVVVGPPGAPGGADAQWREAAEARKAQR